MKTFTCEISLHETLQQVEVRPVNIEYHKFAGEIEASYDLELVKMGGDDNLLPASCFTPETIAEAIKQAHEDRWLDGEITDWLKVDRYADEMDRGYDRMVERRMGCM